MNEETPVDALAAAVAKAGSQSALAEKLSELTPEPVSQARIWNWLKRDMRAPAEVCPLIERLTGVACERLRPDVDWGYLRAPEGRPLLDFAPDRPTAQEGAE